MPGSQSDVTRPLTLTLLDVAQGCTRPILAPASCGACQGTGRRLLVFTCARCAGSGLAAEDTLTLKVPAGIEAGWQMRLRGRGLPGTAGPGDLYVVVSVEADPRFERDGTTLRHRRVVADATLRAGGHVEIATLEGAERLAIPPGTPSGTVFSLAGRGLPTLVDPTRGVLLVEVVSG